jgi:hypothetical protein
MQSPLFVYNSIAVARFLARRWAARCNYLHFIFSCHFCHMQRCGYLGVNNQPRYVYLEPSLHVVNIHISNEHKNYSLVEA